MVAPSPKTKHTPGPWELHAMLMGESVRICKPTPKKNWQGCTDIAEARTHEDAVLIAAAPDLLAALEGLVRVVEDKPIIGERIRAVHVIACAAILKARGGAS